MTETSHFRLILAAYGVPGIMAMARLFAIGFLPNQISLLTHEPDERNRPLWDFASANLIKTVSFHPKSDDAFAWVYQHQADVLFSLYYRRRIPSRILELPKFGCVNFHPSLLPNYQGCFSVPWAIINGESSTGFTYHYMVERFDQGNIILQGNIPIYDNDTAFSLFHRLIMRGLGSLENVVEKVLQYHDPGNPQPESGSYYPRELPYDGKIDVNWDEQKVERFIRAMYFPPHKGVVLTIANKEYEVNSVAEYRRLVRKQQGKIS